MRGDKFPSIILRRIPRELLNRLDTAAKALGMTRRRFVLKSISERLKQVEGK